MSGIYDVIIIGGGVAGFSAAMYAGRLKMKTLVIAAIRGGTIVQTNDIANWPGIKQTDGITLATNIEKHATSYEDVSVIDETVIEVKKSSKGYTAATESEKHFSAKTLIFATGTEWRKLEVPGEKEFAGRGVHYCALCDGYFYKEKIIAVVGGADSATKEAVLLTQWAKKVYMVYRGEKIRPEPITLARADEKIKQGKLEIINNANIIEIKGADRVTNVLLDREYNGSREFKLDGIFVAIGHTPNSSLAKSIGVNIDKGGHIKINRNSETNLDGVFAAGDVTDTGFKQAIIASAEGVHAIYSAYEYLKNSKNKE